MPHHEPTPDASPTTVLIVYPWTSFWAMGENAGVESFYRSARGYADAGHVVHVVMPGDGSGQTTYDGMHLHTFPYPGNPMYERPGLAGIFPRIFRYWHFRRALKAACLAAAKQIAPDVVVAFGPHAVPVARRTARRSGVPNVTRLFGQSLSLFIADGGQVSDRLRFLLNFPEIIAFRTPCAALVVHDDGSCGDRVARYFGVPAERLFFWRDGVDFGVRPAEGDRVGYKRALGLDPDAVVVGSIGRLSPERQLDDVIDAFAAIAPRYPQAVLLFVGDGALGDVLRKRAQDAGVADRVFFPGAFARDRMREAYGAMDVAVSVSPRTNMTNATLEAMAAGLPVLALDAGTTASVIRDGDTGVLVREGGVPAIAAGMERLVGHAERRRDMGERARHFIEDEFDTVDVRVRREVDLVITIARR